MNNADKEVAAYIGTYEVSDANAIVFGQPLQQAKSKCSSIKIRKNL